MINELNRFKNDPLKAAPVAPLALLRCSQLLRGQNKSADAAQLLQDARNAFEGPLASDPVRAAWASLLVYHHGLAVRETGKLVDAQKIFEQVVQKYATSNEAPDAAWRAGQCRHDDVMAKYQAAILARSKSAAKPEEIAAGRQILADIAAGRVRSVVDYGLASLNIISCPSCSRVENEAFIELAAQVKEMTRYAEAHKITIAVMGCRVNGPGETDDADLGLWCGPTVVNLKRGKIGRAHV